MNEAPTIAELLGNPLVRNALEDSSRDSLPSDATNRHEEGGWIYMDKSTGQIFVRRARAGDQDSIDLRSPPENAGSYVVGTFHTHPNPSAEGWAPGPSLGDSQAAIQ